MLGERLGMESAFHVAEQIGPLRQGNLVLTRGHIDRVTEIALPRHVERRGCVVADIILSGASFRFANTHLSLHRATRTRQIALLAEQLKGDTPLVLTGDFNCKPAELAPLADFLTPAAPLPTYPSVHPSRALDYVWYSRHWRLLGEETRRSYASDHLPLVVDLELP